MIRHHNVCKNYYYINFKTNDKKLPQKYKLISNKIKNITRNDFRTQTINMENISKIN